MPMIALHFPPELSTTIKICTMWVKLETKVIWNIYGKRTFVQQTID